MFHVVVVVVVVAVLCCYEYYTAILGLCMFLVDMFSDVCQECSRSTTDVFNSQVFWDSAPRLKIPEDFCVHHIAVRTSNLASDTLSTRYRLSADVACIRQKRPLCVCVCVCGRQPLFLIWISRYGDKSTGCSNPDRSNKLPSQMHPY